MSTLRKELVRETDGGFTKANDIGKLYISKYHN